MISLRTMFLTTTLGLFGTPGFSGVIVSQQLADTVQNGTVALVALQDPGESCQASLGSTTCSLQSTVDGFATYSCSATGAPTTTSATLTCMTTGQNDSVTGIYVE